MAEHSKISWTHNTFNPWLGCDKIAPECAHCYIDRVLKRQGREPWGAIYRSKTWGDPLKWQRAAEATGTVSRVFTCSLSDFFHVKADPWRDEVWDIIKRTPNMVYLILTKRPELMTSRLPQDWPEAYPNVWPGVSAGCLRTLNKMDTLRDIPIHPKAVRFLSAEPLLEDISKAIRLKGFGWIITGGESGSGAERLYLPQEDWRAEFDKGGRRTMLIDWAHNLRRVTQEAAIPFFFKQVTAPKAGEFPEALGRIYHEVPRPPMLKWASL